MTIISAKEALKLIEGEYTNFYFCISHLKRLFPFSDVDGTVKEPTTPTSVSVSMTPMIIQAGVSLEGFWVDKSIDWDITTGGNIHYKYTITPRTSQAASFMFLSTIPNGYMIDPTLEIK